ncbi:MAG: hypothetical protein DRN04_11195 [Thermoprotei archaeon]|nr:MAG: hypothetical protein DRN04_11195 [Thermoprotei archaeon]
MVKLKYIVSLSIAVFKYGSYDTLCVKKITIEVPEWVSEEEVKKTLLIIFGMRDRISADEIREILGIETREHIEAELFESIRKRERDRIKWLYSTQA